MGTENPTAIINRVSRATRVTIPKTIVDALGVAKGDIVEFVRRKGEIVIRKACENENGNPKN